MGEKSKRLFQKARTLIPGGVNSPVRAGKAVGLDPPFIARAKGCHLWDVDRKRYIDYVGSWGPMILGHSHPSVVKALQEKVPRGTSYGAPTELEVEMAGKITSMVPSIEMVRMVNSGTEATMSAIRLARGFTCREKIIKFEGCYHGHADSLLVSAGSGVATFAIPGCPGVPADLASHTISLAFNRLDPVVQTMEKYGSQIAAIILEPIPGNMGVVLPDLEFLKGLRELTSHYGSILIFDEVISGFRVGPGGAQGLYGITPDLTCLGKIIGGGLPVGAYGGKKAIMQCMAPEGNIYQAGTLSGNPLAMAAGLATLRELEKGKIYEALEEKGRMLFTGLEQVAKASGLDVVVNWIGSLGTLFFTGEAVTDFDSAKRSDPNLFKSFYAGMLEQGIYLAPSAYEAWFVSAAHDHGSIQKTIQCAERSFGALKRRKIR
jgi:glutamate-1-semialdehyde 2,1-aminomutase